MSTPGRCSAKASADQDSSRPSTAHTSPNTARTMPTRCRGRERRITAAETISTVPVTAVSAPRPAWTTSRSAAVVSVSTYAARPVSSTPVTASATGSGAAATRRIRVAEPASGRAVEDVTREVSPRRCPAVRGSGSRPDGTQGRGRGGDCAPCAPGRVPPDGSGHGEPQPVDPRPRLEEHLMTISQTPAPARSDLRPAGGTTTPARPFLWHGRMLSVGALMWAGVMVFTGVVARGHRHRGGRLRHRLRRLPDRRPVPASGALAHPCPR